MEITVVGSGTVVPNPLRAQSCVAVRAAGETLVMDLGAGAVRGMVSAGLDPFAVDRVLLTHFHPDHTIDLVNLLFAMQYGAAEPRTRPLRIAGPRPFFEFWRSVSSAWGDWMVGSNPLQVTELPVKCSAPLSLSGVDLSWAPVEHRPESVAYRLEEDGRAFVYTGDTEYCEAVVELARGAHTLLIECSFGDDAPVAGHLTPSGVARVASEADVGRVVLTHLYPAAQRLDLATEVGRGYGGEILVARDGLRLRV